MIKKILGYLVSPKLHKRILSTYLIFFTFFELSLVISYFVVPDGFFRGKHPIISTLDFTGSSLEIAIKIFSYNLIIFTILTLCNLIAQRSRLAKELFIPIGYSGLFSLAIILGTITGSWSFENNSMAPALLERVTRLLNITSNAGFLEISAYVFITAGTATSSLYFSDGRKIIINKGFRSFHLKTSEIACFLVAIFLLFLAALIESKSLTL